MRPGPSRFTYVAGRHEVIPSSEIVGRRVTRHICARCGANSDNGDCGHNCRSLTVMA